MSPPSMTCVHNEHRNRWKHIQDVKERKKVQNRIAQRTYRQRIRQRMADLEELEKVYSQENDVPSPVSTSRLRGHNPKHSPQSLTEEVECSRAIPITSAPAARSPNESIRLEEDFRLAGPASSRESSRQEGFLLDLFGDNLQPTDAWKDSRPANLCSWEIDPYLDQYVEAQERAGLEGFNNGVVPSTAQSGQEYETDGDKLTACLVEKGNGEQTYVSDILPHSLRLDGITGPQSGRTALHIAAEGGNMAMLLLLLSEKADGLARDCLGMTALHVAIENGHSDVSDVLIKRVPSIVGVQGKDGQTCLHLAALQGRTEILAQLISAGGDLEAKDVFGRTALHLAVSQGHDEVIAVLLKGGADVNARMGP